MSSPGDASTVVGLRSIGAPLQGEVTRQRLIDRMASRWNVRLLGVEAPGGFGKSTAMAQAVRDNAIDPSGIDIVVRVTSLHDAFDDVLADAAAQLVGSKASAPEDPATGSGGRLVAEVARRSPNDVAIWIDDAHRLTNPGDHQRLADLLDVLPANGHLVVLGRTLPKLPVARLAAADAVSFVDARDLRFDDRELERLAAAHGADPSSLSHTEGWPAMSRLALVSHDHSREYVFDEVVSGLSDDQRTAITLARIVDEVDSALLRRCGVEHDLVQLLRSVPLVSIVDERVVAHDLWEDFRVELVNELRHTELVESAVTWLSEQRRFTDAIEVGLRHRSWHSAGSAIIELLLDGDGLLGAAVARRWSSSFPAELHDTPEVQLLDGVLARLEGSVLDGVELVRDAATKFADRDDGDGFAASLHELGTRGWVSGDPTVLAPMFPLVARFMELGHPRVLRLVQRQAVVEADLRGDYQAAIDAYRDDGPAEVILRHRATLHFFLGEVAPGSAWLDQLVERSPTDFNRRIRAMHQFMGGEPEAVAAGECPGLEAVDNSREQALHHVWESVVCAALGRVPPLEAMKRLPLHRVREQMFLVVAEALTAIHAHDEDGAAAMFDEAVTMHGADDPMVRGELLRFLPVPYVLSPAIASVIDALEPAGWHAERLAMSKMLLAGRDDGFVAVASLPTAEHLVSVFPLPWSVELVALAAIDDVDGAGAALDRITRLVGRPVQDELRWLERSGRRASGGARQLLASVPLPPGRVTEVHLFGSPTVLSGEQSTPISGRRSQHLLGELAVAGQLSRVELADAMWPDSPQDKALGSLRVAVRDVRRLLDPDRDKGSAPFHLRDRLGELVLVDTEYLRIDVREAQSLLDLADAIDAGRFDDDSARARRRAFEIIRPGWSATFDDIERVGTALRAITMRAVAGMCQVAEQLLAADDPEAALVDARSVTDFDPFTERAHAVGIAARLALGDLEAAGQEIERCLAMLGELGVGPQPGTQMLIRRYGRRADDGRRADLSIRHHRDSG